MTCICHIDSSAGPARVQTTDQLWTPGSPHLRAVTLPSTECEWCHHVHAALWDLRHTATTTEAQKTCSVQTRKTGNLGNPGGHEHCVLKGQGRESKLSVSLLMRALMSQ